MSALKKWWPKPILTRAMYTGRIMDLLGRTALTKQGSESGLIWAQFEDKSLGRLASDWHEFSEEDWEYVI